MDLEFDLINPSLSVTSDGPDSASFVNIDSTSAISHLSSFSSDIKLSSQYVIIIENNRAIEDIKKYNIKVYISILISDNQFPEGFMWSF